MEDNVQSHWPYAPPVWPTDKLALLLKSPPIPEPPDLSVEQFIKKSNKFPRKFGTENVRMKTLRTTVASETLERNINSAYPLVHEYVLPLFAQFLIHKTKYGSPIEQDFYRHMSLFEFVDRLLKKRAVTFMGSNDKYLLLDGTTGAGKWNTIGTVAEEEPLTLENYLSYEEIKLSAFIAVSSYTYFTNYGNRSNKGVVEFYRENIQPEGVIIGLVGARLSKAKVMDFSEIIISKEQNTKALGYGDPSPPTIHTIFAEFYEEECFLFIDAVTKREEDPRRFISENQTVLFDNLVYSKRIAIPIDTLLMEANERAKETGKMAYVHVVGLGLGVWKYSVHQNHIFVKTFLNRIEFLSPHLTNVSDVYFAYISGVTSCGDVCNGSVLSIQNHPQNGIKIHFGKRDPHVRLLDEDEDKLLVVSYAWDGNALPGNEFWLGKLGSTGDSAAASSTQISELHNPHVNTKVCAENLRIVTKSGLISFEKYRECFSFTRKY